ncbi:Trypanosome variant surface glycoprotein C-terminal domain containing protein, putative [Trypanosoma equiperdum]|uniref:Trypanosome variant surface glycoprotein C-terminal domain containing protein, putative n=1 Tax=Trypanosoma equiperdum TaxID=5694 RepID=A0A1G4IDE2_TRYEQ|nr:Trypanosome variant surface glycoprotein C-terminal domain containing protein, putative [Trypanosoma equiperdum]
MRPATATNPTTTLTVSPLKCKSPAETAEKCPHTDCVYNVTTKECKPKPGTEETKTGTGESEKEGTATSGCARHGTNKKACGNDKTGDKKNCAWRKGKQDEDDKDTEKRRNSSILADKQLALMASEFVSFVEF